MIIEGNRLVQNERGCGIKTQVRGIRAVKEFWEMCDLVSASEGTTRNELIVRATLLYCTGQKNISKD